MRLALLHGVLGPYDELIFLSIALIFLIVMGISWLMSRNMEFEEEEKCGSLN